MPAIIAGGVLEKDNKYLLVQEAKEKCRGKWNLPAGHLDPNEILDVKWFTYEEILKLKKGKELLENIDVLVDGLFEIDKKSLDLQCNNHLLSH